jgi:hypothetical protein
MRGGTGMDLVRLQDFLLWCLLINCGIYLLSLVGVLSLRGFMCKIHKMLFGISEETASKVIYQYLAVYKLFIVVFNFTPWIAIQIIR